MVDVLSQNEIDALLAALSSGEMDAEELKKEETQKKVRAYDFKRAYVSLRIIFELNTNS